MLRFQFPMITFGALPCFPLLPFVFLAIWRHDHEQNQCALHPAESRYTLHL